jgi:hypothetical protein
MRWRFTLMVDRGRLLMQVTYTCYSMASKSVDGKKIAFYLMSEDIACVNSPTNSHYIPNVGVGLIINFPGLISRLTTASKGSKLPIPLPKVANHVVISSILLAAFLQHNKP